MKMVLVDWVDSHSDGGWKPLSEIKKDALLKDRLNCQSVGYLILETKDFVLLAMSLTIPMPKEEQNFTETMQIPKCSIGSIKELSIT